MGEGPGQLERVVEPLTKVALDKTWESPCLTLGGCWGSYPHILSVDPGSGASLPGCLNGVLRLLIGPSLGKDNYNSSV